MLFIWGRFYADPTRTPEVVSLSEWVSESSQGRLAGGERGAESAHRPVLWSRSQLTESCATTAVMMMVISAYPPFPFYFPFIIITMIIKMSSAIAALAAAADREAARAAGAAQENVEEGKYMCHRENLQPDLCFPFRGSCSWFSSPSSLPCLPLPLPCLPALLCSLLLSSRGKRAEKRAFCFVSLRLRRPVCCVCVCESSCWEFYGLKTRKDDKR